MKKNNNITQESSSYRFIWNLLNDYLPYIFIFLPFALISFAGRVDNFSIIFISSLLLGPLIYLLISSVSLFLSKILGAIVTPFLLTLTLFISTENDFVINFIVIVFIYSIVEGITSEMTDFIKIIPKHYGLFIETTNRIVWIFILFAILHTNETFEVQLLSSELSASVIYLALNMFGAGLIMSISNIMLQYRNHKMDILIRKLKIISSWNIDEKTIENDLLENEVFKLKHVNRTIMFGDIRGFTKFSETNHINIVVKLLHELYHLVEDIAKKYESSKPEFIADEFILFFDDTQKCLACAIELNHKLNNHLANYNLGVGIGIDKGNVVEGIVGSKKSKKYTAFGRAVNTASRLQSNADKGQILISKTVLDSVENLEVKKIEGIVLKGVSENFEIFQVEKYISEHNKAKNLIQKLKKILLFKQLIHRKKKINKSL